MAESKQSSVPTYPTCPRCGKPVHRDAHELRAELVNAHPSAPEEHVRKHDSFHHDCAAAVWTTLVAAWRGTSNQEESRDG